jgi:hypothetical protein
MKAVDAGAGIVLVPLWGKTAAAAAELGWTGQIYFCGLLFALRTAYVICICTLVKFRLLLRFMFYGRVHIATYVTAVTSWRRLARPSDRTGADADADAGAPGLGCLRARTAREEGREGEKSLCGSVNTFNAAVA